ncbi:MAG: hypothetical protein OJF49_000006 [Ktedonobacterales bacterium]|nr:MAG: hypothetical protein OJF49_000006 [Ktedonobacterales bacterium]
MSASCIAQLPHPTHPKPKIAISRHPSQGETYNEALKAHTNLLGT